MKVNKMYQTIHKRGEGYNIQLGTTQEQSLQIPYLRLELSYDPTITPLGITMSVDTIIVEYGRKINFNIIKDIVKRAPASLQQAHRQLTELTDSLQGPQLILAHRILQSFEDAGYEPERLEECLVDYSPEGEPELKLL